MNHRVVSAERLKRPRERRVPSSARARGGQVASGAARPLRAMDRFPYSKAEFKRVRAIQFGILSPEELVRVPAGSESSAGAERSVSTPLFW